MHAGDIIRGTRLHVRLADIESRFVFMHCSDHARGEHLKRFAVFTGTVDDLVFDVGDVAHIGQIVTAKTQPACYQVKSHHAAAVTQMAIVVHGHAAHVHAHIVAVQRLENFFALGERVVNR